MARKLWSKKSVRPHEELAQEILRKLARHVDQKADAQLVRQFHVHNVARRIDLYLPGRYLRDAMPPPIYEEVQHLEMLVELESSPLRLVRFRTMIAAHINADAQLRKRWHNAQRAERHKRAAYQSPGLLIYANGMRRDALAAFTQTSVPCVFHANYAGLSAFLLDLVRVTKESRYNHLRLMSVPRAQTHEELIAKIRERLLSAREHSSLNEDQLQELMMSYLKKTVEDKFQREDIFQYTLHDAYRQGESAGLEQGLERGLEQGLERGLEQGLERGLDALRSSIADLAKARNIVLAGQSKARLAQCEDMEQLQAWLRRVATTSTSDVEL